MRSADFEKYFLSDSCVGVVDVEPCHRRRVAEILAERHPGVIFLWDWSPSNSLVTICAARGNRRRMSESMEEKLVAAGEAIARSVARKYPAEDGEVRGPTNRGWCYCEYED
jgi:hypothetical protein